MGHDSWPDMGSARIIVALDVPTAKEACDLITELSPIITWFKIGLELISSQQAQRVLDHALNKGARVFWDNKFSDIPNTVGRTSKAVSELGVEMFNVHVTCGIEAMKHAVANKGNAKVLAVTVLTSLDSDSLAEIGFRSGEAKFDIERLVINLTGAAAEAGVDGIICSAQEVERLRQSYPHLDYVTPGIRPEWAVVGDQKRVLAPRDAILAGAGYLVVGRPITAPPDGISRIEAAYRIVDEVKIAEQEAAVRLSERAKAR